MWFRRRMPATKPTARPALGLTPLEGREVPAAFSFANGLLTVNMPEVATRSVNLDADRNGVVVINGWANGSRPDNRVVGAPGGVLRSQHITAVRVIGSEQSDAINLQGVAPDRGFNTLDGRVEVTGGGARDTIYGSAFNDVIRAGAGDDRVFGGWGNDRIDGGAGADHLYGDGNSGDSDARGGSDLIDGGSGDDYLNGGGGSDQLVGGAGADSFQDSGRVGWDIFWVDSSDHEPRRGWGWAGAEEARRSNPPRV